MYVFDASALIAFLSDEKGAGAVEAMIKEVEAGDEEGIIGPVTLAETFHAYAKNHGEAEAYEVVTQLKLSKLRVLPLGEDIAIKAGSYKLKGMPLADAIVAATAKRLRAKLVAADAHFRELDIDLLEFR